MEKSWIGYFALFFGLWLLYGILYYENPINTVSSFVMSFIFLMAYYKMSKSPIFYKQEHLRKKTIDTEYSRKLMKYVNPGILIGALLFVIFIASLIANSLFISLISMLGFVASFVYVGFAFFLIERKTSLLKSLTIALFFIVVVFALSFNIWQVRLASLFSLFMIAIIMAVYGGYKMILSVPYVYTLAIKKSAKNKKNRQNK